MPTPAVTAESAAPLLGTYAWSAAARDRFEITYTEPGLQGDRSSAGTKPATVETGYEIQVPLFLETGTKVKVDTRTGDYLGRVN